MNRMQAAEQLRKAMQMFAKTLTDEEAMEIATVYPAYAVGVAYAVIRNCIESYRHIPARQIGRRTLHLRCTPL